MAYTRRPAPNVIVSVDDASDLGASNIEVLRNSLRDAFSERDAPDGTIRLGWQSMNGCPTIPAPGCRGENALRPLDRRQRERFIGWAAALAPSGPRSAHRMLFNTGDYLRAAPGIDSPWAAQPGVRQAPMLACRRAYNLFITGGGWNDTAGWQAANPGAARSIGNADGSPRRLPDGTSFDPSTPQATHLFRDDHGSAALPTLADLAFHHWATDLQPQLPDSVAPRIARPNDEQLGRTTLAPYWNPRNDPASWQHLVTHTVAFGAAANGNGSPRFGTDTHAGGDYAALAEGAMPWPDPNASEAARQVEPWHMALNGRGSFLRAADASSLTAALRRLLGIVRADATVAEPTAMVASAISSRAGSTVFVSSHDLATRSGDLAAYVVAADGTRSGSALWQAAARLDAADAGPDDRVILSASQGGQQTRGITWTWPALAPSQRQMLDAADGLGRERWAYLRGDHGRETWNGGDFRPRRSRLGDIVNARPWFVAGPPAGDAPGPGYEAFRSRLAHRPAMLYVGANDGMLHGFSAADGVEKLAYVPVGLHAALPQLTDPASTHRYFVDGSPLTGDLHTAAGWRTHLAGFLGAGGKGYFVLDVTDPARFGDTPAAQTVVLDRTDGADRDIGHILSEPVREQADSALTRQITRLNNDRWALVTGNGYNSENEDAVLLIQYLDGDRSLHKLAVPRLDAKGGNGLAAPRLLDLDGNGTVDLAYAGDLQGQLWKFDLSGASEGTWQVAFDGRPLYTATVPGNARAPQAITTAPVWLPHPQGGLIVVFGTGRLLTDADRTDMAVQSVYGVHDDSLVTRTSGGMRIATASGPVPAGRDALVAQTLQAADGAGSALGIVSSTPVAYTGTARRRGWFLDLPAGERVVAHPGWFEGRLIDVPSMQPVQTASAAEESCTASPASSRYFRTTLNALDGNAPKSQLYADSNQTNAAGGHASRDGSAPGVEIMSDGGRKRVALCLPGQTCVARTPLGRTLLRPSWRQLQ